MSVAVASQLERVEEKFDPESVQHLDVPIMWESFDGLAGKSSQEVRVVRVRAPRGRQGRHVRVVRPRGPHILVAGHVTQQQPRRLRQSSWGWGCLEKAVLCLAHMAQCHVRCGAQIHQGGLGLPAHMSQQQQPRAEATQEKSVLYHSHQAILVDIWGFGKRHSCLHLLQQASPHQGQGRAPPQRVRLIGPGQCREEGANTAHHHLPVAQGLVRP
eukprot:Lithocolla_globosa_v1_NODE_904_length_3103_cov_4.257874.p2 type:complete len:214 gc:universal NODE_904_length_3103_cov_4.257874:1348-1989(+)